MAQAKKSFLVKKFTNPSGDLVFRVSGRMAGDRIRKNFSTRAEAEAECDVLELQLLQLEAETGVRTAITRLKDDQHH